MHGDPIRCREIYFHRTWPAFCLALFAATWRLWIGQTAFPQVPLFRWLCDVPRSVDAWLFAVAIASCALLPWVLQHRRWLSCAVACFVLSMALLIALDQHRAQPWAYQFLIYALLLGLALPGRQRVLLIAVALSIYVYSALGKFDYQFLHTVGQQIVRQLAEFAGLDPRRWAPSSRLGAAALLPAGELTVAGLLAWPRTRRVGVVAAIGLHATLILVLSPLGLGHQPGVLLWNLFFMAQALFLFWPLGQRVQQPASEESVAPGGGASRSQRHQLAVLLVLAVVMLPLVERLGLWDHWTSWALYSPHSSRVTIEVFAPAAAGLPQDVRQFVDPNPQQTPWREISIDRWSVESLGVPIYPQARFQLGVALALQQKSAAEGSLRVRLRSASSRLTGHRQEQVLRREIDFRRAAQQFLFNTQPRSAEKS